MRLPYDPGQCGAGHRLGDGNAYVAFPGTRQARVKCLACLDGIDRDRPAAFEYAGPLVAGRTRCPTGHPLTAVSVWLSPDGDEFCKACMSCDSKEAHRRFVARRPEGTGLENLRFKFEPGKTVEESNP